MNPTLLVLYAPWPSNLGFKAVVTTRLGGVSSGAWEGLNLGPTSGDDEKNIEINFALMMGHLSLPFKPKLLKQIHGNLILKAESTADFSEGDGWILSDGLDPVAIQVADCLPVFLARADGAKAAVLHAGWKGVASGILRKGVEQLREGWEGEILGWVGPGIDSWAYQVGLEVRDAVLKEVPGSEGFFIPIGENKVYFDISRTAELALVREGVMTSRCKLGTWSRADLWYSWRRQQPTGRQLGVLWKT